jgi:hypothetical protein
MLKATQIILSGAPLIALPALAAEGALQTGITGIGPAKFLFTLAIALFLTLIFRSTANHLARFVTARIGQWRIRTALAKRSPDVLHDFILPGAYGGLAKLDHAILTAGGILCIQTKHYNGVVFGGEDEAQWTNVDGVTRRRFLNPLIQNEGRARALRKVVPEVPVANVVIFSGSVEFTTPPPKNVIHIDQLESYIAKFVFGPSKIDDWTAVWMTVNAAAMVDADTRKDFQAQLGFG